MLLRKVLLTAVQLPLPVQCIQLVLQLRSMGVVGRGSGNHSWLVQGCRVLQSSFSWSCLCGCLLLLLLARGCRCVIRIRFRICVIARGLQASP